MYLVSVDAMDWSYDKAQRPKVEVKQKVLKKSLITGGLDLTTTICHRYTPREELVQALSKADVVVSAAGVFN